jgi:Domain of Unknown Function (DUF1080)
MRTLCIVAFLIIVSPFPARTQTAPNTLNKRDRGQGWRLLFEGKSTAGWVSAKGSDVPITGWEVKDGILTVTDHGGEEGGNSGDIMTTRIYRNFELFVDFRITHGANSGIKYFVDPTSTGKSIGFEYQILDDAVHPDAKAGKNGNRTEGSLYDLIPAPADKLVYPVGEWNTAHIIVRGAHVEHRLNAKKLIEFERFTPEFRQIVAGSKFQSIPDFGELSEGHILLQDHGFSVSFRNVKIRELPLTK